MLPKRLLSARMTAVCLVPVLLAGCAAGVDRVKARQCPSVGVLATADSRTQSGSTAHLDTASLTCFLDNADGALLAEVTIAGRTDAPGAPLDFFVAALNEQGEVTARTQMEVAPSTPQFTYALPRLAYGKKGEEAKARLVVGFVLNKKQLADNRAAYRKQLGL